MSPYDLAVIGAGPGGYVAAIRAAELGLKTACIEKRKTLGGTCLNIGCIPSKALLHSSELYDRLRKGSAVHGLKVQGLSFDLPTMMARKEQIVAGFTKGIEGLFKKHRIDWIVGSGQLTSPHVITVGGQQIEAKSVCVIICGANASLSDLLRWSESSSLSN